MDLLVQLRVMSNLYLKKMGGIILVASIIVWALGYFPHNEELDTQAQQEQSYIGRIGKTIEPILFLLGLMGFAGMNVVRMNTAHATEEDGWHHPRGKYHRLGFGLFPSQ